MLEYSKYVVLPMCHVTEVVTRYPMGDIKCLPDEYEYDRCTYVEYASTKYLPQTMGGKLKITPNIIE